MAIRTEPGPMNPGETYHESSSCHIVQHDGYYYEWELIHGKRQDCFTHHGVYVIGQPVAPVAKPAPVEPKPAVYKMSTGEAKADREWQERLRVERSFNDTYSRERKA